MSVLEMDIKKMDQDRLFSLIGRNLNEEASKKDKQQLNKWLRESDENKRIYLRIKKFWQESYITHSQKTDSSFAKVLSKINTSSINSDSLSSRSYSKKFIYWAAVISLIIVVIFYKVSKAPAIQEEVSAEIAMIEKENPSGQKSKIHLPDGSFVWLNAQSRLAYPERFDSLSRQVMLTGEAFFEVTKDAKRPFSVVTGDIKTIALGTSFNIKAYEADPQVQVVLATGKVKVKSADKQKKYLEPGEGLLYHKVNHTISLHEYDVTTLTAWKDGILIFNDANFSEIVEKLERWYGVTIQVNGKAEDPISYTAKFNNEYLSNVLESMSFGRPFQYEINDKIVTLKFLNYAH